MQPHPLRCPLGPRRIQLASVMLLTAEPECLMNVKTRDY